MSYGNWEKARDPGKLREMSAREIWIKGSGCECCSDMDAKYEIARRLAVLEEAGMSMDLSDPERVVHSRMRLIPDSRGGKTYFIDWESVLLIPDGADEDVL